MEIVYAEDDQDAYSLALQIMGVLGSAKWNVAKELMPEKNSEVLKLARSLPANVFIEVREITQDEISASLSPAGEDKGIRTPYSVLVAALLQSGLWIQSVPNPSMPVGNIRVIVSPKP